MPIPLIAAAIAGTAARAAGTRLAAGAAEGMAGRAAAGRAMQFGGAALQRNAGAHLLGGGNGGGHQGARRAGMGIAGAVYTFGGSNLGSAASQQYSSMLQPGQFGGN